MGRQDAGALHNSARRSVGALWSRGPALALATASGPGLSFTCRRIESLLTRYGDARFKGRRIHPPILPIGADEPMRSPRDGLPLGPLGNDPRNRRAQAHGRLAKIDRCQGVRARPLSEDQEPLRRLYGFGSRSSGQWAGSSELIGYESGVCVRHVVPVAGGEMLKPLQRLTVSNHLRSSLHGASP